MQPITERSESAPVALTGDSTPHIVAPEQKVTVPNKAQVSAEHFMDWLKRAGHPKPQTHHQRRTCVDAYLGAYGLSSQSWAVSAVCRVTPASCQLAGLENVADWQWAQKQFERLHRHHKQASGLNIWTCDMTGPRKARRLHGYLLDAPSGLFEELPPNNPYLSVKVRSSAIRPASRVRSVKALRRHGSDSTESSAISETVATLRSAPSYAEARKRCGGRGLDDRL